MVVAASRAVRYGAIAAIASLYGRRFIVMLRHIGHFSWWWVAIILAVIVAIVVLIVLRKRLHAGRPEPQNATHMKLAGKA